MSNTKAIHSYAVRRVNPFLGVLQVIETPDGRAISANGVVWDIEPCTAVREGWGSLNRGKTQMAYYRYGLWSEKEGLVNRPLAPRLDGGSIEHQAGTLIACVQERQRQLPFRLEDVRELWLFDQDDRKPLALLASAIPNEALPSPEPKYWSASIGANGVPSQRRYPGASELETLVRKRAGFNVKKHWIIRNDDGSGVFEKKNRRIDAGSFPAFLISEDWSLDHDKKLAGEYIAWISPALLTLQGLSTSERVQLEKCLHIQAQSIEHHWHLYPEVVLDDRLEAARVQSRLIFSNTNLQL